MVDLGIDLGSAYTTVSYYKKMTQELIALNLDGGNSPYVPSIVSCQQKKNGEIEYNYGTFAKDRTGKKGVSIFKAFKMLLPENENAERCKLRGYDEVNTPVKIATIFLERLIRQALHELKEDKVGQLIICAPEIWGGQTNTLIGRSILRDICSSFDFVEKVQVVKEPEAASAFFAYNFKTQYHRNFEGNILLVDYGGGTLDITVTNVSSAENKEGTDIMEIKSICSTGAGENVEGDIGKAGIVYMEKVIEKAIRREELVNDGEELEQAKFFKAVDELERQLKSGSLQVYNYFEVNGTDDPEDLEDEFTTVEYRGEDVEITYGLLLEVYNEVIRPTLKEKLDDICAQMKGKVSYQDGTDDSFKIALVGGFGSYYLVRQQLQEYFRFNAYDRRFQGIIRSVEDCEKAISLGAALLASNIIGIRYTSDYSIGISNSNVMNGEINYTFAIQCRQEIEFGHIYMQNNPDGTPQTFTDLGGGMDIFRINFHTQNEASYIMRVRASLAEQISAAFTSTAHLAQVGFSLDSSGVLSLHIYNCEFDAEQLCYVTLEDVPIELADFSTLFKNEIGAFAL